jgi:hypothetical protein
MKRQVTEYITNVNKKEEDSTVMIGGVEFSMNKDKRVPHDKVCMQQYMEGSLRILRAMMLEEGMQLPQVLDYVNYLIQVSIFAQTFPWRNVLSYDKLYREEQATLGFRWGKGSSFLMTSQLQKPDFQDNVHKPGVQRKKNWSPDTLDPKSGKAICQRWNGTNGCQLQWCNYAHVCRTCFANHPEVQHKQSNAPQPKN